MKLHMMISFVGASIFFCYYFGNQLCSFQLYKLLAATIYFKWDDPYFNLLCACELYQSCVFFSIFLLNAMLWLNIFVAVDLINMIKYPFKPKDSQFYLLFSFLSSLTVAVLNSVFYWYEFEERDFLLGSWFMTTTVIYLLTAVASIIYAYRKMRKPGIS